MNNLGLAKQDLWGLGACCPFVKMIPQWENHFGKRKACYNTLWLCSKGLKILFFPPYWTNIHTLEPRIFWYFYRLMYNLYVYIKSTWLKKLTTYVVCTLYILTHNFTPLIGYDHRARYLKELITRQFVIQIQHFKPSRYILDFEVFH